MVIKSGILSANQMGHTKLRNTIPVRLLMLTADAL